ncbi:GDSL-type esterase/lipase family protein [Cryobacterium sp. GrIS_2_6]|uniref:SGNH/GDSL hydrolase family protein n=1 Tax=Cryobacterium sp. GrIS_2_6 TaxID=3162785 RepID=UPI002E079748|nr:lysophospholipase L1-like esterase [Cryobacterium psychrotolerans]MEC5149210.1 lysophospholipase L1-like esterase [Cryobacterium psychrotolerans]MEC5149291.1 lysophospholipase L1-like esterase [Cryobacterium psychrotolerans]
MPFTPKVYQDGAAGNTPILAADLNALENEAAAEDILILGSAAANAFAVHTAALATHTAQIAAGDITNPASPAAAVIVPRWTPSTVYAASAMVTSPNGDNVTALAAHTSGSTFTPANWALSPVLSATFARSAAARFAPGRRWAFLGDSITYGSNAAALYSYVDVALRGAGARARDIADGSINAGVPGDTSNGALGRFDAQVAAFAPQAVHIQLGTNDVSQDVTLAVYSANMKAIVAKCKALGIPVTIGTVPPQAAGTAGLTDAHRLLRDSYNLWLRLWAPGAGVILADTSTAVTDPATGDMLAAYSSDGTHPTTEGHRLLGLAVAAAMKQVTDVQPAWFVSSPSKGCLVANPIMAGAGTIPTGWSDATWLGGSGTVPTFSLVADTSGTLTAGQWSQFAWTAAAAASQRVLSTGNFPGSPFAAGTVLLVCGRLQIDDVSGWLTAHVVGGGNAKVSVAIIDADSAVNVAVAMVDVDAAGTISFAKLVTVAAAHTNMALTLRANVPVGVSVNIRMGQVGVYNLTALGVGANN